ncbi:MAG: DUF4870 domain-containing protein [Anaerolineaceae bacterium]|nr:DUF4870 domain-containing protein [Anaerolineaceae bacterium]
MTEEKVIDSNITSDDKLWALLSYLISPLLPIIVLLMDDKRNRPFLKRHAVQALVWSIVIGVLSGVLAIVIIGFFIAVAGAVFSIIWAIKAYNGEEVTIPVITDFIKKQGWA